VERRGGNFETVGPFMEEVLSGKTDPTLLSKRSGPGSGAAPPGAAPPPGGPAGGAAGNSTKGGSPDQTQIFLLSGGNQRPRPKKPPPRFPSNCQSGWRPRPTCRSRPPRWTWEAGGSLPTLPIPRSRRRMTRIPTSRRQTTTARFPPSSPTSACPTGVTSRSPRMTATPRGPAGVGTRRVSPRNTRRA
jgi:hypothetical protein